MNAPRIFWASVCVALLSVAASVCYYFFIVLPAVERRRNEFAAEQARTQTREKQIADCAEQARRVGQDMGKYSSLTGARSNISGVSNHFNLKLGKCIVDVEAVDKNSTAEYVMDAYEQSSILWCNTQFTPRLQRTCMDAQNNRIDNSEADKRIDALLKE